jgi:hypothetical protein
MLPATSPAIAVSEEVYYFKDRDTYYCPDAWDKAGRLCLWRRWRSLYYVTFGDGATATVTRFSSSPYDQNVEPAFLQTTIAEKYNYGYYWILPLAAICIALPLVLVKNERTKLSDLQASRQ